MAGKTPREGSRNGARLLRLRFFPGMVSESAQIRQERGFGVFRCRTAKTPKRPPVTPPDSPERFLLFVDYRETNSGRQYCSQVVSSQFFKSPEMMAL